MDNDKVYLQCPDISATMFNEGPFLDVSVCIKNDQFCCFCLFWIFNGAN